MDGKCLQLLYVLHSWQTWELILFCCRSCDSSYVCIATASPAKFPEAIEKSGVTYVNPPEIQRLFQMPEKFEWMNVGQDWEMILRQKISTLAWKQKDDSKDNNLLGKYINVEFWHTVVWKKNLRFHKCTSDVHFQFISIHFWITVDWKKVATFHNSWKDTRGHFEKLPKVHRIVCPTRKKR